MGSWRVRQGPHPMPTDGIGRAVTGESRKTSTGLFSAGLQNTSGLTPAPPPSTSRYGRVVVAFRDWKTCFSTRKKQPVESPTPTPPTRRLQASRFPPLFRKDENKLAKLKKKTKYHQKKNHSSGVMGAFGQIISLDSISSAWAELSPRPSPRLNSS